MRDLISVLKVDNNNVYSCEIYELRSPLDIQNNNLCPSYTVYIYTYKNGNKKAIVADGASSKSTVLYRSTNKSNQEILMDYQGSSLKNGSLTINKFGSRDTIDIKDIR